MVCDIRHDADERGGDPGWGGVRQGVDRESDRGGCLWRDGCARRDVVRVDFMDGLRVRRRVCVCALARSRALCVRVGLNGLRSGVGVDDARGRGMCAARARESEGERVGEDARARARRGARG